MEAERVGFTTFSEHWGEEVVFALMPSLLMQMGEAVREQGGVVHSLTGDGVKAVFGASTAFKDAPLRACRSTFAIL